MRAGSDAGDKENGQSKIRARGRSLRGCYNGAAFTSTRRQASRTFKNMGVTKEEGAAEAAYDLRGKELQAFRRRQRMRKERLSTKRPGQSKTGRSCLSRPSWFPKSGD